MGVLDALLGNASQITIEEAKEKYGHILAEGEVYQHAYKLIRDMFLFTDKRLILVDVQGITGKKIEFRSIPYRSITHFAIETAGSMDLDAELKIWVSGRAEPIEKQFNKQLNIYALQSLLATYVLR